METVPGQQQACAATNCPASPESCSILVTASQGITEQLAQLHGNVADLDDAAERLVVLVQGTLSRTQRQSGSQHHEQHESPMTSSTSALEELQVQVASLRAEKQHVEADRQEMAVKQGNYKGIIAQLEGALSSSERRVREQQAAVERLHAQVSCLSIELQEARGTAAQTPDRCRTAARALKAQADRATFQAKSKEAQVKKLKKIVQSEAHQLSELLEFAEQERLTLLEKEAALQEELRQATSRAYEAEAEAVNARASAAAYEQQVKATQEELATSQLRASELGQQLAATGQQLEQEHAQAATLTVERDIAARNLLRAEAELNDVGEYSTKMFRQVRFISHMLDKNSTLLGKVPDMANLARDLRSFVANNARHWDYKENIGRPTSAANVSVTVSNTCTSHMGDSVISGVRDVKGRV